MSECENIAPRGRMPPYRVYRNFLDPLTHASLLAWAIENEARFEPSLVLSSDVQGDERHDPSARRSLVVADFGPVKALVHQRLLNFVPTLISDLRVAPFEPSKISLELVANNDGAFFQPHIDTLVGGERKASDRLISAVYYFHAEPKAFAGGALRLYPFAAKGTDGNFAVVPPDQNTLVAFPSWATHEVLPVSCPSQRFSDSRFNVNCWVHRNR
jgi:SM-20-related protein